MVRTYWFVPVFNEASGNLDLQPFARADHVESKSSPCSVLRGILARLERSLTSSRHE